MKQSTKYIINELCRRFPNLIPLEESIKAATDAIIYCYQNGGKLLVCGNGGSAADSLHIVGELMKGFNLPRELPAYAKADIGATCAHGDYLAKHLQGALPVLLLSAGRFPLFCRFRRPGFGSQGV